MGIELMWTGARWKSLNIMTKSKFLRPNCTRSRCAISISAKVTTKNGVSVKLTRQSVDGNSKTFDRKGTPLKPKFRNGISTCTSPLLYHQHHRPAPTESAIFCANSLNSLFKAARRLRSSASCSCSSSSPYRYFRFRFPVSSTCASDTSRKNCTSLVFFFPTIIGFLRWTWIMVTNSESLGWKNTCLMLLKRRSMRESLRTGV